MTSPNDNEAIKALRLAQRIRRLAAKDDLIAHKSRKDGKWYFSDFNNVLQSPEQGLDDDEALGFLNN
jgi:hypothetical protein